MRTDSIRLPSSRANRNFRQPSAAVCTCSTSRPLIRARLLHVLTDADRRQKSNPYALAHYCGALQHAEELMQDRAFTLRQALKTAFCGPIVNRLVKAAGEPPLTPDEIREVR